ncbi:hypothetical protein CsSME_00019912 [Camellia sinensis var. sinensis]
MSGSGTGNLRKLNSLTPCRKEMSPMFNEKVRRFVNGSGCVILCTLPDINKLRIESADPTEDAPEMHYVEGAFVETLLPKAKSPPQDALLKLETKQTFTELSQESSMFVFKLGLVKLQCCLLMNGLVVDANELLSLTVISVSMSYMLLQEIWVLKLDSS